MTTKEQERKALEQIKKIIAGLGDGSYIKMAFEGCIEDAQENIDNDFGCSMKQRYEQAQKDADYFHQIANSQAADIKRMETEKEHADMCIRGLQKDLAAADAENVALEDQNNGMKTEIESITNTIHDKDMEIIMLKARLYDLLCKEV